MYANARVICHLCLAIGLFSVSKTAWATMLGDDVFARLEWSNGQVFFNSTQTVGAGIEFTDADGSFLTLELDLDDGLATMRFTSTVAAGGLSIVASQTLDVTGIDWVGLPLPCEIIDVTGVQTQGSAEPFTVTFGPDSFQVNFDANMVFNEPGVVKEFRFDITAQQVPEPSTLTLTGLAFIGLVAYGWRRRRRQRSELLARLSLQERSGGATRKTRAFRFCAGGILACLVSLMASPANGGPIFVETFDNGNLFLGSGSPGPQFETGLQLLSFGDVLGWTEAGHATVHAVDRDSGPGENFAVMIWSGFTPGSEEANIITLDSGIAANDLGTVYAVDFEVSPAVYMDGNQTTTASDALLIEILRADNSVLASYSSFPGAWAGTLTFSNDGFTYTGDGSGPARIRVSSLNPL